MSTLTKASTTLALALVAGLSTAVGAQTVTITPGGVGLATSGPVFRYTPAAGVAAATSAGLTSATGLHTNYSFAPDSIASPSDALWRAGWFFRVQGESRALAFPSAATSTVNTANGPITVTQNFTNGNNLGTLSQAGINYTARLTSGAGGWDFSSQQNFEITSTTLGPTVAITNTLVNSGFTPVTIHLFWCTDADTPPSFSNDILTLAPTPAPGVIRQGNFGGAQPSVVFGRGNSTAYAGRGGVGFPFGTTVFDDMTSGIITNFNNTLPPASAGFDRNLGLQWTVTLGVGESFVAETFMRLDLGPCNASDVAGPGQDPNYDRQLTADDIIVFLNWFFASDLRADVAGPGQSTVPDSQFTADDIIVFLNRFFVGC